MSVFSLRYMARHPWLFVLSVLGVALGVAVVLSIDIANASAGRAFQISTEVIAGRATHEVRASSAGIPDSIYAILRKTPDAGITTPVVDGYGRLGSEDGQVVRIVGIDPLTDAAFRSFTGSGDRDFSLADFILGDGAILAADAAGSIGIAIGDSFDVVADGIRYPLSLLGEMVTDDSRTVSAVNDLLIVDVGTAQRLLRMPGRLSRIEAMLPSDSGSAAQAIRGALPAGVELVRTDSRTTILEQLTRAFRLNLNALSLLALIVGMFLTYNAISFSVVQRRELIGRLRAIGATRRDIFGMVVGEGLLIGLLGTAIGLLLGSILGRGLVRLVSQTINDLYFVVNVRATSIPLNSVLKGVVLGIGATILSALVPARFAAGAEPSVVMRRSESEAKWRLAALPMALAGALVVASSIVMLAFLDGGIVASYVAIGFGLVGYSLCVPWLVVLLSGVFRPVLEWFAGIVGGMAAGGTVSTLSRTSVATAALSIAVAASIGVSIMVTSFRSTVVNWLDSILQADVYVQVPGSIQRDLQTTIDAGVEEIIRETPGVARSYGVKRLDIQTSFGPSNLTAVEAGDGLEKRFKLKSGEPGDVSTSFRQFGSVLVSEPYAFRHGLELGDHFWILADSGRTDVAVVGVYFDYGSDQGVVLIERENYERLFTDHSWSGVALYAEPGIDLDSLINRTLLRVGGSQDLLLRSNRDLRTYSLDVFDRTFTITRVLRLLAIFVAFVGIVSALMSLQLERSREFAVLRAVGMTSNQQATLVNLQTMLMGLYSGLLAVPLGIALAAALVFVINKRAFGWTLQFELSPAVLGQAILLSLFAALLAGIYPASKLASRPFFDALRNE
ncbi:MAG: FtsX-like permease family protein [Rhodothermales bacterium]